MDCQCYSLMSPDSVSILLIGVSWCGECPKRYLMNWMLQNMTVLARAQSWFGMVINVNGKTDMYAIENGNWRHWGIAMRFSISLWGHMRVLSVKNLFWWTVMPVPTVHTSLTPIWNMRQSFIWTGLLDHWTWIRLSMHVTFFSMGLQPRSLQELKDALVAEWSLMPQNRIQTLITSMRRRCRAVIDALGRHTRY